MSRVEMESGEDGFGRPLLHRAAAAGAREVVEALLEACMQVEDALQETRAHMWHTGIRRIPDGLHL